VEKEKAVEVLQRAGQALPENAELRQFAMGLFWQVGEKDRAREMAHELTRLQPNDFQSWLARAALEMRLGDEAAAEQSVIKAIELNEIGARREIRQSPVLRPVLQDPDFLGRKGGIETP
jgi:Flp pilus assembly protein TadD